MIMAIVRYIALCFEYKSDCCTDLIDRNPIFLSKCPPRQLIEKWMHVMLMSISKFLLPNAFELQRKEEKNVIEDMKKKTKRKNVSNDQA